ncbi:tetratricopeptide repeat protein [Photobacterium halotolerans]|uniref:tetratricopeptide repeat protein n=1 Tax=Photobacterium halotolerans TaxID=265726 RepID=UPI001372FCD4|nr:tetratricopeptide repeat protein [Photobacterium halotolerans]NAW85486.1 tetratricopeptide repeat protein [Photobacterium halotolerans]
MKSPLRNRSIRHCRYWAGGLLAMTLMACAGSPEEETAQQTANKAVQSGACGETLIAKDGMKLSMVKQQMDQGQYYLALAALDDLDEDGLSVRIMRADSYRKLGKWDEASALYKGMLNTCLAGSAYHGLGLIASYQGNMQDAMKWMEKAAKAAPVEADVRNDLGFLLLVTGQDQKARDELLTALELNPSHPNAAKNLWFVLLKTNQKQAAATLASRFEWDYADQQEMMDAITAFRPLQLDPSQSGKESTGAL